MYWFFPDYDIIFLVWNTLLEKSGFEEKDKYLKTEFDIQLNWGYDIQLNWGYVTLQFVMLHSCINYINFEIVSFDSHDFNFKT